MKQIMCMNTLVGTSEAAGVGDSAADNVANGAAEGAGDNAGEGVVEGEDNEAEEETDLAWLTLK